MLLTNPHSAHFFSNPVRAAYVTSLESQITTLKEENNTLHKQQNQYTLRLLSMNETLREKEELARAESDQLRKVRDEVATLRRKVDQHNELMSEKDRTAQVRLHCLDLFFSHRTTFPDPTRRVTSP